MVSETTRIFVGAVSETVNIDGELLDENGNSVPIFPHNISFGGGPYLFFLHDRLDAGTYYIKVTSSDTDDTDDDTGPYTIRAFEDGRYNRFLTRCSNIDRPSTVQDPQYGCQWHLNNEGQLKDGTSEEDINVEAVWDDSNLGAGINVAVVDDGMDYTHDDLSANVVASRNHDYTAGEGEATTYIYHPLEDHGTAVAGLIAARDNSLGVRGVAPRATIYGYNLLLDSTDENEADAAQRDLDTDVSNNSWGPYDGPGLDAAPSIWEMAVEKGITEGSDGKGIFYVWAAGNGGRRGDNSNLDGYANHYGVTAVCAVNDQGQRAAYSEEGANLWVCAPSNDSSRDRHGITTTDNDDFYRNNFGGTSAAAPIVSGVAALVRSADTALTWRDVKLILAASARQNDADNTGWEDGALQYGSDTDRYHFNHEYGFGVVDAKAAVELADGWTTLPTLEKETARTSKTLNLHIPDRSTVSNSITMGSDVEFIEFVEINADFDHTAFRDLQIELTSPAGKVSVLSVPYPLEQFRIELHSDSLLASLTFSVHRRFDRRRPPMAASLSPDLRIRVIRAIEGGQSRTAAARRFGVSLASAVRWMQTYRRTGRTQAKPRGGDRRSQRIEAQADLLLRAIEQTPDLTLAELRARLLTERGESFALSTLHAFYRRHRITFKKRNFLV